MVNKPQGTWTMSKKHNLHNKPTFSYSVLAVVRSLTVKLWLVQEISHENSIAQWGFVIHESVPFYLFKRNCLDKSHNLLVVQSYVWKGFCKMYHVD